MTEYLSPYMTEIWIAVADAGKAMTPGECKRLPVIAEILRRYHGQVRHALDKLSEEGYLRRSVRCGGFTPHFWVSEACRVPSGRAAPLSAAPEKAAPEKAPPAGGRKFVNSLMPTDTTPLHEPMGGPAFDFRQWPSRRGNRLHFRDGRITDLEGRPV